MLLRLRLLFFHHRHRHVNFDSQSCGTSVPSYIGIKISQNRVIIIISSSSSRVIIGRTVVINIILIKRNSAGFGCLLYRAVRIGIRTPAGRSFFRMASGVIGMNFHNNGRKPNRNCALPIAVSQEPNYRSCTVLGRGGERISVHRHRYLLWLT